MRLLHRVDELKRGESSLSQKMDVSNLVNYAMTQEREMVAKLGPKLSRMILADYFRLEILRRTPNVAQYHKERNTMTKVLGRYLNERVLTCHEMEEMSKRVLDARPHLIPK